MIKIGKIKTELFFVETFFMKSVFIYKKMFKYNQDNL